VVSFKKTPNAFSIKPLLYLPLEEGKEGTEKRARRHAMLPWDTRAAWKRWGSHMHLVVVSYGGLFSSSTMHEFVCSACNYSLHLKETGKHTSDLLAQIFLLSS